MHPASAPGAHVGDVGDASPENLCYCLMFCAWFFLDTFLALFRGVGLISSHSEIFPPAIPSIQPVRPLPLNPGGWFSGQYILLEFEVLSRLFYISLLVSVRRRRRITSGIPITSALNYC